METEIPCRAYLSLEVFEMSLIRPTVPDTLAVGCAPPTYTELAELRAARQTLAAASVELNNLLLDCTFAELEGTPLPDYAALRARMGEVDEIVRRGFQRIDAYTRCDRGTHERDE